MKIIEKEVNTFLTQKINPIVTDNNPTSNIKLYYRGQMTSRYRQEEQRLRNIINNHIQPTNGNDTINLQIYYKAKKLQHLFIKNNPHNLDGNKKSHVVYQYTCSNEGCQSSRYIGYTECTLVDRLRNHAQHGAIITHNTEIHQKKITTNEILQDTSVLCHYKTKAELILAEALLIKERTPTLNLQREGEARILSIFQ